MFLTAALLTDGQYDENVSHRRSDLWVVGLNRLGEERGTWVEAGLVGVPFNLFITMITRVMKTIICVLDTFHSLPSTPM